MATQIVVELNGEIIAYVEFADWEGEPNREFTAAMAGDPNANFGAGTAKILRGLFHSMFPSATITVSHASARVCNKDPIIYRLP